MPSPRNELNPKTRSGPPVDSPSQWWGEWTIAPGSTGFWQIGSLQLEVSRPGLEWRVSWAIRAESVAESVVESVQEGSTGIIVDCPSTRSPMVKPSGLARFAAPRRADAPGGAPDDDLLVVFRPRLADRQVVTRPTSPFYVLPGDTSEIFVSSPLWVSVFLRRRSSGTEDLLVDLPVQRPSDTWFGPSTTIGELLYATRTRAAREAHGVPRKAWRAMTLVQIVNRGSDALLVERFIVPAPNLSLYQSTEGHLATDGVRLEHAYGGEFANLEILSADAQRFYGILVTPPRQKVERNAVIRAFSTMFS